MSYDEHTECDKQIQELLAKVKELGEQIEYYRGRNRALEIDNKLLASDAGQNPFDPQKNYYIEMVAFRERLAEAEGKVLRWRSTLEIYYMQSFSYDSTVERLLKEGE